MPVTINCSFRGHTARAIRVDLAMDSDVGFELVATDENMTWIPKSQLIGDYDFDDWQTGMTVTLKLTDWIARQKNITAQAEVNLERYEAREASDGAHMHYFVEDVSSPSVRLSMCEAGTMRIAQMIAAALNLTQGKV